MIILRLPIVTVTAAATAAFCHNSRCCKNPLRPSASPPPLLPSSSSSLLLPPPPLVMMNTRQYSYSQSQSQSQSQSTDSPHHPSSSYNNMVPQQHHPQLTTSNYSSSSSEDSQQSQQQQQLFSGINLHYPGLQQIHDDPPVYSVDNFLSSHECAFLIQAASDSWTAAPVVGQGDGMISQTRTSSTCYLDRADLPDLMRKVSAVTGKCMEHCELPQVGRYLSNQQYYQHYDAFNLNEEDGRRFATNGGQRTVTVLIYLNTVAKGGQTYFPILDLTVQPKQGTALIFFPAYVDGTLDTRALHAALPAIDSKYVSQIWIRQGCYNGQPSKRLNKIMGQPLTKDEIATSGAGINPGPGLFALA